LAGATKVSTGTGPITFGDKVDGPFSLEANSAGTTTFTRAVGSVSKLASLTTDAGGTTALDGGSVKTTGPQSYGDAVVLGSDTTLAAGSAAITLASEVSGPVALAVTTAGTTTFGGPVVLSSLSTDTAGTTVVAGGSVTTTAAAGQRYGDALVIGKDAFLAAGGGAVTFARAVNGTPALIVNTSGLTTFGGAVFLGSLATDAAGVTRLDGGAVTTSLPAGQVYGDPVTLGARTLLAAGTGAIRFSDTVDGAFPLTVGTSGATTFAGAVGGTTKLVSLETDAGGTVSLKSVATTGSQRYHDDVVTLDGTYATAGAGFTVDRATRLAGATTVATLAGPLTFGGTVDGSFRLVARSTGPTSFVGAVGSTTRLDSLATDFGGKTRIDGGSVRTAGALGQVFEDAVRVTAATLFDAGTGPTTFATTLDGQFPVDVKVGGAVEFQGRVGGASPLAGLTLSRAAAVRAVAPITLRGTGARADGLVVGAGVSNLAVQARGSLISGFSGSGIRFLGTSTGSHVGGFAVSGNGTGLSVGSGDYTGSTIHSSQFVASAGSGVVLAAAAGGVRGLTIGGTAPFGTAGVSMTGNRIVGNARHGIETTSGSLAGSVVVANTITGNGASPAGGSGISIAGDGLLVGWAVNPSDNRLGNLISGNAGQGVAVTGRDNAILSNAIHSNGERAGKGIDVSGGTNGNAIVPQIVAVVRDSAAGVVRVQVRVPGRPFRAVVP
ncbi:MAG: right-handed parallel beta-helix repeat-containing protein, partial [Planctomycetia bacterium]|nr:right-handed parallel beta-helix repeat-containing protein [Planctomycetia bacterium]